MVQVLRQSSLPLKHFDQAHPSRNVRFVRVSFPIAAHIQHSVPVQRHKLFPKWYLTDLTRHVPGTDLGPSGTALARRPPTNHRAESRKGLTMDDTMGGSAAG